MFTAPKDKQAFGEWGERIAARWLEGRGWRVLARRYRCGHRDLDLVVARGGTVAFVEVKARRSTRYGDPVEAVNWRKRRELARSAQVWIDREGRGLVGPGTAFRFDVVGVLAAGSVARIRHLEDAFALSVRPPARG